MVRYDLQTISDLQIDQQIATRGLSGVHVR